MPPLPIIVRLLHRIQIDQATGCWNWMGGNNGRGYGVIGLNHRSWYVHRISHLLFIGPIPDGFEVDHLCKNRGCCNPFHLEAVPQSVNNARSASCCALNALKTHCKRGHLLDGENLYRTAAGRSCKRCHKIKTKEWKKNNRDRWNAYQRRLYASKVNSENEHSS